MQVFEIGGAHAHFRAIGAHERAHGADGVARGIGGGAAHGVHAGGSAAAVVAVEAEAALRIDFGVRPRAGDERELGADEAVGGRAGVLRTPVVHVEEIHVAPQADDGTELVSPLEFVLQPRTQAGLPDARVAHGARNYAGGVVGLVLAHLVDGAEEAVVDLVVAEVEAHGGFALAAEELVKPGVARADAADPAAVGLLELIADGRGVEVGEIGEEIEVVEEAVGQDAAGAVGIAAVPLGAELVALGLAAVAGVERVEAREAGLLERAGGNLVGGVPVAGVAAVVHVPAAGFIAGGVAQVGVAFVEVVAAGPRAVGVAVFEGVEEIAVTELHGAGPQRAGVAETAAFQGEQTLGQGAHIVDAGGPGGGEVAHVGEIDALAVVHLVHQLGDEGIEFDPALPVAVRGEIDRDAVHEDGEIGAMIEVEAAQEVLVGLPRAAVLRDDDAGDGLEDFGGARQRAAGELLTAHGALGRGIGDAEQIVGAPGNGDFRHAHDGGERGRGVGLRERSVGGDEEETDGGGFHAG